MCHRHPHKNQPLDDGRALDPARVGGHTDRACRLPDRLSGLLSMLISTGFLPIDVGLESSPSRSLQRAQFVHTGDMKSDRPRLFVLAFGALCWAVANTVNHWMRFRSTDGGWFNYAPTNAVAFSPNSTWVFRELLIWLIAIAVWLIVSMWLLRATDRK